MYLGVEVQVHGVANLHAAHAGAQSRAHSRSPDRGGGGLGGLGGNAVHLHLHFGELDTNQVKGVLFKKGKDPYTTDVLVK